jgi:hypothetical protein
VGVAGLLLGAICLSLVIFAADQLAVIKCLSLAFAGIAFPRPAVLPRAPRSGERAADGHWHDEYGGTDGRHAII